MSLTQPSVVSIFRAMRTLLIVLCATGLTTAGAAQVRGSARLGATWSSVLVKDVIIQPIEVQPGIAPTLTVGASLLTGQRYRVGLEAVLTTGSLSAEEAGATTDLGGLRTATILLTGEGPLMVRDLYWRVGVGLIKYLPGEKQGLFQQGGPTRLTGTFTVEYRRPWRQGWEFIGAARYGLHGFTTAELESRGFSRAQAVHRVGLEAGVARYF